MSSRIPDFAGNQRIYLSFVEAGPNGTSGAALGYGRLILGQGHPRIEGFKVIWRQEPKVSGGGHFRTASPLRPTAPCSLPPASGRSSSRRRT